jgi:hypothetical protein
VKHTLFAGAASFALAAAATARQLEVVFCEIPASPKSAVPGALDNLTGLPEATNFKAIEDLIVSPDGSRWIIRARTQQGADEEGILLLGSGTSGTMFAQEGQPVHAGAAGEVYDFFGSSIGRFNTLNQFAYSARARGGSASVFQKVIYWDGTNFSIPTQMGDLYTGLIDVAPNPVGDETVGNSIGSIHLLDDGRIGAHDSTIGNIHSSKRPAVFYDRGMYQQVENTLFLDYAGTSSIQVDNMGLNSFYTTPDGAHWILEVDLDMTVSSKYAWAYDGRVRLEPAQVIPGSSVVVGAVFNSQLAANGDWYARGRDNSGTTAAAPDWAARNFALFAKTGDSVEGGAETYGDTFYAFTGNASGDWALVANTNEANPAINEVVVVNGVVVAREGDPVDVDGNGMFDDGAFLGRGTNTLGAFQANDFALTDDMVLYFFAYLNDGAGNDLGSSPAFGTPDAMFRLDLGPSCAIADVCDPALPDVTDGCTPDASWTRTPDVTQCNTPGPSDFLVTFSSMSENKNCNVVIGKGAPIAGSWSLESARCFPTPYTRTGFQDTGDANGAAGCGGEVALDVEAYLQGGNPLLTPVIAGDEFVVQAWYRDPSSAKTTQMTDAVHFTVCP